MIYIAYKKDLDDILETKFVSTDQDKATKFIIDETEKLQGTNYHYELHTYEDGSELASNKTVFSSDYSLFKNFGMGIELRE